jgi:hypothetical protein
MLHIIQNDKILIEEGERFKLQLSDAENQIEDAHRQKEILSLEFERLQREQDENLRRHSK